MKIIFDVIHPADVHLFKNIIWELKKQGHEVLITARDKDVTLRLLDAYGFEYYLLSEKGKGIWGLFFEMLNRDYKLYRLAKKFDPNVLVGGPGNVCIPEIGTLLSKPSVIIDDTEHARFSRVIISQLATRIYTPKCYMKNLGSKQVVFNGYKELAYLHPRYFEPNPEILDNLGLSKGETYIVLRLISWGANHDIGQFGIKNVKTVVKELEKYGYVFITSERNVPRSLNNYIVNIPPERLHDLLYYATLYFGEGATTAAEAAILGTHAIYTNTLRLGYLDELEEVYELVYNFSNPVNLEKLGLQKAKELLQLANLKKIGYRKRKRIIKDKTDVTKFILKEIISNFGR